MRSRHHIRHLPVLKEGKLDGLVSMGDLASEVISRQAFTIDQLQKYIGSATLILSVTSEGVRLEEDRTEKVPWRKWGPYLSVRHWGTLGSFRRHNWKMPS